MNELNGKIIDVLEHFCVYYVSCKSLLCADWSVLLYLLNPALWSEQGLGCGGAEPLPHHVVFLLWSVFFKKLILCGISATIHVACLCSFFFFFCLCVVALRNSLWIWGRFYFLLWPCVCYRGKPHVFDLLRSN